MSLVKSFSEKIKKNQKKKLQRKNSIISIKNNIDELYDLVYQITASISKNEHANPLNSFGKKCFSQSDEDGITIEIFKRLKNLNSGSFLELGVGDGTENNTLILLSLGWKGFWVGGSDLAFDTSSSKKLKFFKNWITLENILPIINKGLKHLKVKELDLISVDLDGNDFYIVEKILNSGFFPKVFILEYNAKFPPPVKFKINYDPKHKWKNDDYFGTSLESWNSLLTKHGYRLLCCNSQTGANCFFVKQRFSKLFKDVPNDINQIYSEPRYLLHKNFGHKKSIELITQIINS